MTTSERAFFYAVNLNFIERLRQHEVHVDPLIYGWDATNTEHTWQQDFRHPESQEVYRRLPRSCARWPAPELHAAGPGLCLVHGVNRPQHPRGTGAGPGYLRFGAH